MGTNYIAPTWRQPENLNKNKLSNYSIDTSGTSVGINCGSMADLFGTASVTYNTSYSIWIKPEFNYNDSTYQTFFGNYASGNNAVLLYYHTGNDRWRFIVGDGSGNNHVSSDVITSNEELGKGEWQHHCVVFDTVNNNAYYYINNQQINSSTSIAKKIATAGDFYIGKKWDLATGTFTGQISQGCIFDYALSTEQRTYLYNLNNPMAITGAKPIAYWPLGDNSNLVTTAGYPNISVEADSVFNFNGSTDYIGVPNNTNLQITNNLTLSCWVNADNVSATNSIIDKFYDGTDRSYLLRIAATRVKLYLGNTDGSSAPEYQSTATLSNNIWYHIATTFSSTDNEVKIYINGSLDSTHSKTDLISSNNQELRIGTGYNLLNYFTGKISNVQIFDTALPATGSNSIKTLYNNGQPLMTGVQPQAANLQAWYKLNQTANWEADTAGNWQIPDAVSSYPQSFDFVPNDFINCGSSINITSNFSYSFWYRSEANSYGSYEFLFSRENAAASIKQFNIYNVFTSTGRILANIYDSSGTAFGCDTGSGISENVWHHIAFCYSPSNYIRLYLDGVLEDENTSSIPASIRNVVGEDLRIGGRGNNSMFLNGQMSNVQIWSGTLTDGGVSVGSPATGQIAELYNNGVPLPTASVEPSSLKAWYKLDNNDVWNPVLNQWEIIDYAN